MLSETNNDNESSNTSTTSESNGEWTEEEMEGARPFPMPTVPDDEPDEESAREGTSEVGNHDDG